MEAPERIYLFRNRIGVVLDSWYLDPCNQLENIEYTRTDAFIEKACEKLKKCMYDNLMFQGRLHREEVIDSFIETFKKYMNE